MAFTLFFFLFFLSLFLLFFTYLPSFSPPSSLPPSFFIPPLLCPLPPIRRGPGQEYVRTALESVIEELAAYNGSLEIDPLKVMAYTHTLHVHVAEIICK